MAGAAVIGQSESGPDEAVDDDDLLELGTTQSKETAADVTLGKQLNDEQKIQLQELIKRHEHIFPDMPGDANVIEHEVKLTSDEPMRSKAYVIPYNVRESLKGDVQAMLNMCVIRESKSPYASPLVIVRKKDGTNRICVDFRKLNRLTVFHPTPIPTANIPKGLLADPAVAAKDIPKTAFVTPDGAYELSRCFLVW